MKWNYDYFSRGSDEGILQNSVPDDSFIMSQEMLRTPAEIFTQKTEVTEKQGGKRSRRGRERER